MTAISITYLGVEIGRAHVKMYRTQDLGVVTPETSIVHGESSAHLTSAMSYNVIK